MDGSTRQLLPLFAQCRQRGEPAVLATIVATRGSTYQKAGARMLIAPGGEHAGLLSGGCLEGDLADRARSVLSDGVPKLVRYDLSGEIDATWGLALGCEGAVDIWLTRLSPDEGWEPFASIVRSREAWIPSACGVVLTSQVEGLRPGTLLGPAGQPAGLADIRPAVARWLADELATTAAQTLPRTVELADHGLAIFVAPVPPPPRLLLLGGGQDAVPLVEFCHALGWFVTVADHRPVYADPKRFPPSCEVVLARPDELAAKVVLDSYQAGVIMSHHLPTDGEGLRVLASTAIGYVGLLGPTARRDRLVAELGEGAARLHGRLRAPVGLDLGGRGPQAIALAIAAELQAYLHGRAPLPAPAG